MLLPLFNVPTTAALRGKSWENNVTRGTTFITDKTYRKIYDSEDSGECTLVLLIQVGMKRGKVLGSDKNTEMGS
jgi:hypothetical protein